MGDRVMSLPGFGGGGQNRGGDFGFGTPSDLQLDGMFADDLGDAPDLYSSAMYMDGGGASLQERTRGSFSSIPDTQSPMTGPQPPRSSTGSNGAFTHTHAPDSFGRGGSGATSPDGALQLSKTGSENNPSGSTESLNSPGQGEHGHNKASADGQSDAPPPPWSELKTKAGKERKRLPLACIACRRKKIRCSGEKPACKHCLRSRIPCVYKVTTRKAAPRTDYMAMLDKRLKRMEERVIKVMPKEEQDGASVVPRAVVKPALPPPPKASGSKKRGAEAAFVDELDEWAGVQGSSAPSRQEPARNDKDEPMKGADLEERNLLSEGADDLPSREVQEHLSEVFFDYVYGQGYHLLHKPSFMRRLALGKVPPVLMLAVCAISARFSIHPTVRTEPAFLRGEEWAKVAREISLRRYDKPNITILIVYLILGLHEFGTCQGGRSWMFGGMAQRMAYALQLHTDLDSDFKRRKGSDKTEMTFTDREIRRRTMWSCFLMDRFNSSGTDRPIFIGEQYIRAQLPIKETFYQMEITGPTEDLEGKVPNPADPEGGETTDARDNMGVAAYQIRLIAVWGKLVNYFNLGGKDRDDRLFWEEASGFQALRRALEEWRECLPPSLHWSAENLQNHASESIANQFVFLHIVYHQALLFMHRFALPSLGFSSTMTKDMPPTFLAECARTAHEAANQISLLIHEGMDHRVVAPFAGYCAFFSSTVHIYGAFSGNPAFEATSKQNLARNVKYLTKMKKYWGMFHYVTENLRELYRRHADAARVGHKSDSKDGEQPEIFQYGDWFDRYPHGVSGTDYEEPSASVKKEPGADAVLGQKSDLQTVEEFFSKLTPPTRAAQLQSSRTAPQQQQAQSRKTAKSKRSKSESKSQADANLQRQNIKSGLVQPEQSVIQEAVPNGAPQPAMNNPASHPNLPQYPQHSSAFPPGFHPPPNPLLIDSRNPMISPLERQMVLDSYAGVTTIGHNAAGMGSDRTANASNDHLLNPTSAALDAYDFTGFNSDPASIANLWSGDPSTAAFFMPFNMEPPGAATTTDDAGFFSTGYDWGGFSGFADFSGVMGGATQGLPAGINPSNGNADGDGQREGPEDVMEGMM